VDFSDFSLSHLLTSPPKISDWKENGKKKGKTDKKAKSHEEDCLKATA